MGKNKEKKPNKKQLTMQIAFLDFNNSQSTYVAPWCKYFNLISNELIQGKLATIAVEIF